LIRRIAAARRCDSGGRISAEMLRHCMAEPKITQAALERHMAQWCSENFDTEPASSTIRDWVAPTFRAIHAPTADNPVQNLPVETT